MLTATYTLVALSVEQSSVRMSVQAFQKYVHANLKNQGKISLGQLEYACDTLNRLYQACHWRKIEMYLIPAIRQATEQADRLLDELSELNNSALAIVKSIQQRMGDMTAHSDEHAAQVCASIDAFCASMLKRLEKEERELFAVARNVICGEAWFSIANQFLLHDARAKETRRSKASVIPLAPPAVAAVPGARIEPPASDLPDLPAAPRRAPALRTAAGE